jgi:hypothetical protein
MNRIIRQNAVIYDGSSALEFSYFLTTLMKEEIL